MNDINQTWLITGSSIGRALAEQYASAPEVGQVIYTWRSKEPTFGSPKVKPLQVDLTSELDIENLVGNLDKLDGIINATGFLHDEKHKPEKAIARFTPEGLVRSIELNTLPTALLAKHARKLLKASPSSTFATISAKVGSIEDNRLGGWYSYRASKAALNMMLKTLAIEWRIALPHCSVAALHPGTVESPLSRPFTGRHHNVMTPEESAGHLKQILDGLNPDKTGRFWSWDGSELPW
jgi:NAD(P)-dependent dehydrogenase (short-subunit alcohol dehydrogenase family)